MCIVKRSHQERDYGEKMLRFLQKVNAVPDELARNTPDIIDEQKVIAEAIKHYYEGRQIWITGKIRFIY